MPLTIRQPTSNTSPDPAQGGGAMNSPTNTGHGSTTASCTGELCLDTFSMIWSGFVAAPGVPTSMTLKATHTSSGSLSGITAANLFTLEYSLDGGRSWLTAVSRTNFTAAQGPTVFSVTLPSTQNVSQIRVRDFIRAVTDSALGHTATATVTIASIQLEITTQDVPPVFIS